MDWLFAQAATTGKEADIALAVVQYGAIGILASLAILAFLRADKRLAAITDRFLQHLEAVNGSNERLSAEGTAAAIRAAEANLAVANTLVRLDKAIEQHSHEAEQRYREERNESLSRHREVLERLK